MNGLGVLHKRTVASKVFGAELTVESMYVVVMLRKRVLATEGPVAFWAKVHETHRVQGESVCGCFGFGKLKPRWT